MENIQLIQDTAVEAAGKRLLTVGSTVIAAILNDNQKLTSLEPFQDGRFRYRGSFDTSSLDDYCAYVCTVAEASVVPAFVDVDRMRAVAYFNLGTANTPGHGDWTGSLGMKATAAYQALNQIDGKPQSQVALINWLEDWNDVLVADFDDNNSSLQRAIASIRKMKISSKAESTHTTGDFNSNRSAMEEIEASGAEALPTGFRLATEPYEGLSSRSFALKLSVLTGNGVDKPNLVLRWLRKESTVEAIAREFKSVLAEKLGDRVALSIGTFNVGK
ncbi:DUF2303 family protein [Dyella sp. 2RAB6]|uniref:DUF2303 family protein n=1 Tax=Dyella sp. 2RAB6 TaxID=3232992 RepID=UPI003F8EB52F